MRVVTRDHNVIRTKTEILYVPDNLLEGIMRRYVAQKCVRRTEKMEIRELNNQSHSSKE